MQYVAASERFHKRVLQVRSEARVDDTVAAVGEVFWLVLGLDMSA